MKYIIGKEYISDEIEQSKPIKDIGYYIFNNDENFAYLHTFEKKDAVISLIKHINRRKNIFNEIQQFKNNKVHNYWQSRKQSRQPNPVYEEYTENSMVTESYEI